MKPVCLAFCLLLFSISGMVHAEEPESCIYSPYSTDATYREAAAPYIQYVEDNWQFYKNGLNSLKNIENKARVTYRSQHMDCSIRFDLSDLEPSIQTKIKLFDKPVFLVFSIKR